MHKDMNCSKNCDHCGKVFYRDKRNTWRHWGAARFCSRTCSSRAGAEMRMAKTPTLAAAFWLKAKVGAPGACWGWSGLKDKDGYPLLTFRGQRLRANRVAILISGGSISPDQHACHSCGNNWCCNPRHIYPGTPKENNSDKVAHGTHRCGEEIYCAKLTDQAVVDIRRSSESTSALAEKYGVSRSAIGHVRSGKTWSHVQ